MSTVPIQMSVQVNKEAVQRFDDAVKAFREYAEEMSKAADRVRAAMHGLRDAFEVAPVEEVEDAAGPEVP